MQYLLKKLLRAVCLLLGVSLLSFVLLEIAPGDFFSEMELNPQISPQTISALRSRYGLGRPLPIRYLHWLRDAASGDFGYSLSYNLPVARLIWPRAKNTILLTGLASGLAWTLALPLGTWLAIKRASFAARAASGGIAVLIAIPDVALALGALMFAASTRLLPAGGMFSSGAERTSEVSTDLVRHLVLPVIVLAMGMLPMLVRHIRSSVGEVLDAAFVRSAEGLGIPRRTLLFRYVLRAAANPLISLAGLSVAALLSASLLVEVILGWPGLGPLLLEAIFARDIYLVTGVVLSSTIFLICGTFLADAVLYAADPRVRFEQAG